MAVLALVEIQQNDISIKEWLKSSVTDYKGHGVRLAGAKNISIRSIRGLFGLDYVSKGGVTNLFQSINSRHKFCFYGVITSAVEIHKWAGEAFCYPLNKWVLPRMNVLQSWNISRQMKIRARILKAHYYRNTRKAGRTAMNQYQSPNAYLSSFYFKQLHQIWGVFIGGKVFNYTDKDHIDIPIDIGMIE